MKYFLLSRYFALFLVFLSTSLVAQVTITMNHPDGNYAVGETVHFQVHSTISTTANYTINRGKHTEDLASGSVQLNAGATTDITIVGTEPENLHFSISAGWTGGVATAMVGVDQMTRFDAEPADFDAFWNGVKAQLAAVPMNAQVIPYNSTTYSTSYTVSLGNIDGRKVYGMLTVPNGTGPFPVVLKMPPYGSFPIPPEVQFAERVNAITLAITIHNAPVNQTDPNAYSPNDATNRDLIYHKHSVTAGIRALDYLTSRPDFNGTDVVVTGVSQGGGLGALVAGLDSRVKLLLIGTPTMGSHAGMLNNHPSGFPFYLNLPLQIGNQQEINAVAQAVRYYELASAAKRFHGKVFLLTSYNDQVTIPETQFIASNLFDGQKVILHNIPGGHDNRPTQYLFGRFDYLRRYFAASNNPPFPWSGTGKGYLADAGTDKVASVGVPISLSGTIEKNTTVNPNIPVSWRKISGPGNVSFTAPNAYSTQATFSQNGTYVLELRGKDTELIASDKLFYTISDRVVVTVGSDTGDPAPTVVLSTPSTNVNGAFSVTATFSESVTGLSLSDFTVTNGSLSNLSGTGSTYTFTVSPANVGTVTILLPSGKVVDASNQGNSASNMLSVQYSVVQNQNIDLALDLVADNTTVPLYSPVNFTLTLSNSGTSTAHNISVDFKLPQGFGLKSSFASVGNYNSWTGVWTLGALAPGATATVQVEANLNTNNSLTCFAQVTAAQENDVDSSPNNNAGTVPSEDDEAAVTVSSGTNPSTNPTVVLSTPSNTVSGPFVITAKFSSPVSGLASSDFVVTNGNAGQFSGSGDTYQITITPSASGNVAINLPANMATGISGGLGNTASNTLMVQYSNTPSGVYCSPNATPWNDWIKRVKIGSIDKHSNKEGYGDFTNLSTDLAKGKSHELTIGYGHGYWVYSQNYRVWIDFNKDNDFDDPGEMVLDVSIPAGVHGSNPPDLVNNIQIPDNVSIGQTRMRVALNRNASPTPCGNNGLGEYEDYTVNITAGGGTTNPGTYCNSASTPWNDWIARVQINSIDNASNKDGYGDFTNLVTDVAKGQNTNITITLGHGYFIFNEYYRVWVDLNQDGDFDDANELVVSKMVAAAPDGSNPAPLVEAINLPNYTLLGTTRMRVSMRRDGFGTACNQGGNGEVEDYTINVTEGGTTGPTNYCTSNATPWNDWIARVQIGSIDKNSSKEGYADFTDNFTSLNKGIPTQISITLGHGYWIYDERYNVWIDLNHDGDFDDNGELVMSQLVLSIGNNTNPPPVIASVLIPNTAMNGQTRMRVSMRRGSAQFAPCDGSGFGETEDYSINIQSTTNNQIYSNLLDFNAEEYMAGVKTDWVVDNAANTDFFVLQRLNQINFVDVAQFEYKTGVNQFEYWDANPSVGMNYYRIELHESNGDIHYSEIKAVQIFPLELDNEKVVLFPTISIGNFKINMSDFQGLAAKIDLINATGQIVKSWKYDQLSQNLVSFDISGKKQGLYFVNIQVDGKRPIIAKVILKE